MTAPDFESQVCEWIGQGEVRIVFDMKELEYISSAGLRSVLVAAKQSDHRGGHLSCCSMSGLVRKVFEVSGFSEMIPIHNTLEEALGNK
jgi:anti-anti-sigma factor